MRTSTRIVGDRSLLLEVDEPAAAAGWLRAAARRDGLGVIDVVPAARTVLVTASTSAIREALRLLIDRLPATLGGAGQRGADLVRIPVRFDGPDLQAIADRAALSIDRVVRMLVDADLAVQFCGFSPGFAYLTGVPQRLHFARRPEPRSRVPAGSVAVADEYAAIYPRESPAGWHIVGTTDRVMFDIDRDPPALLTAGMAVRFEATP